MKLKKLKLINYRNFENIEINLENKNIFIGANGIGKSNIMYALRVIFEQKIRRNGIVETDFFDIQTELQIIVELEYNLDSNNKYTNLLCKSQWLTESSEKTLILKLESKFDEVHNEVTTNIQRSVKGREFEVIKLYQSGRCDLDDYFYLQYVYPNSDLRSLFRTYTKLWLKHNQISKDLKDAVEAKINEINEIISQDSEVTAITQNIKKSIDKYIENTINISVLTKHELSEVLSNLHLYNNDLEKKINSMSFSDGHKKLISYSLINLIVEFEKNDKIPVIIVEEPENNFHNNLQLHVAQKLIENDYVFITTHSPNIVQESYNLNLIRIYENEKKQINSGSTIVSLPDNLNYFIEYYKHIISNVVFNKKVLLVEGYTEELLYKYMLKSVNPNYYLEEIAIINIRGVNFKEIYDTLKNIGLKVWIKTDNDIKINKSRDIEISYSYSGWDRIKKCVGENTEPILLEREDMKKWRNYNNTVELQKHSIYKGFVKKKKEGVKYKGMFLSKVDFENDLYEVIPVKLNELLDVTNKEEANKKMTNKKFKSLWSYIDKLSKEDFQTLYDHEYFECVKEINEYK